MSEEQNPKPDQPAAHESSAMLAELQAKCAESERKYLYLYAEFETFKKRAFKERIEATRFGWESVARDMVSVLDNLERALAHSDQDTGSLKKGLEIVIRDFQAALQKSGITAIETVGKPFDPNQAEAVGQEAGELGSGMVLREESRGYLIHGRLLRPARVIVCIDTKKGSGV